MKKSSHLLVVATLAGVIGATTLVPSVFAQPAPTDVSGPAQPGDKGGMRPHGKHGGGRGGFAGLICSTDGATQLQTRLDALATRLTLTATQQPLFDAYRTAALAAQTTFADACATVQPAATATTKPDMLTAMQNRLTNEKARSGCPGLGPAQLRGILQQPHRRAEGRTAAAGRPASRRPWPARR
jgi:hypothetical protein